MSSYFTMWAELHAARPLRGLVPRLKCLPNERCERNKKENEDQEKNTRRKMQAGEANKTRQLMKPDKRNKKEIEGRL